MYSDILAVPRILYIQVSLYLQFVFCALAGCPSLGNRSNPGLPYHPLLQLGLGKVGQVTCAVFPVTERLLPALHTGNNTIGY